MKKRSQAGPDMLFRCYCCGHLRMGQREPFWGAQGTEDDKCSERALGNRVRRLVAVFVLRHSRPFSLVWSEPHCGPEVTFQQELPANGNARVWRKRASWEGMGSTAMMLRHLQSQVGNKGGSLASHVLSAATHTFGEKSWLDWPSHSRSTTTLLSSSFLFLSCCLIPECPQKAGFPNTTL